MEARGLWTEVPENGQMDVLLAALRAGAEPTRLCLLALLTRGELTVSELVHILGQSQPRISRHLKLLTEAGLLTRHREGSWVFHRLAESGPGAEVAQHLNALLPDEGVQDHVMSRDRERLAAVKRQRAEAAAAYFRDNAESWDKLRSLHVDDAEVEKAISRLLPGDGIENLLDVGTGTGRMLELLAPRARRLQGIDLSREMLAVARANAAVVVVAVPKAGQLDPMHGNADEILALLADQLAASDVLAEVLLYSSPNDRIESLLVPLNALDRRKAGE